MRLTCAALIAVTIAVMIGSSLLAEVPNRSPERLTESATNIVTGKVLRIYSRQEREAGTSRTRYVAEVRIETVEKGEGLTPDTLIYARYLTQVLPKGSVGTTGHRGLPNEGERVRVYLARNTSDGFDRDNNDGGFNVIFPNGFERLAAKSDHAQ